MMKNRWLRWHRKIKLLCATALTATVFSGGCLDSDIAKRFRQAYVPGLTEGLKMAVLQPGDAEAGLRRAWAALNEGIAAAFQLRTPPTTGSNSRSGSP